MKRTAWVLLAAVLTAGVLSWILDSQGREQEVMGDTQAVQLPIAMYHSVTDQGDSPGEYIIPTERMESDLKFLKDRGFETVTVRDVIAFVQNGTPLPEKPVMLTFDDGHYNNYANVYPLLEKYQMKAVLSPVGALTEQFTQSGEISEIWSYCTGQQLQEMAHSGLVEIQNHSFNFHQLAERRGCLRQKGENEQDYQRLFWDDTKRAQDLFVEWDIPEPVCYTYPYGALNEESEQLLKQYGFAATLGCEEGINVLTKEDNCLRRMKRYNRDGRKSTEVFWSEILAAMQ